MRNYSRVGYITEEAKASWEKISAGGGGSEVWGSRRL